MTISRINYDIKKQQIAQPFRISKTLPKKTTEVDITPDIKKALKIIEISLKHDINNALTPIFFITNYLKGKDIDPEIRTALEMILSAATKIKNTVASINKLEHQETIHTTEYLQGIQMLDLPKTT